MPRLVRCGLPHAMLCSALLCACRHAASRAHNTAATSVRRPKRLPAPEPDDLRQQLQLTLPRVRQPVPALLPQDLERLARVGGRQSSALLLVLLYFVFSVHQCLIERVQLLVYWRRVRSGLPSDGAAAAARAVLRLPRHPRRPHRLPGVPLPATGALVLLLLLLIWLRPLRQLPVPPGVPAGGGELLLDRRRRRARLPRRVHHDHRVHGPVGQRRRLRARDHAGRQYASRMQTFALRIYVRTSVCTSGASRAHCAQDS